MLRVELLGQVRITHDERIVSVVGAHAQVVLAMLAVERDRAIAQDELAEVLWPSRVPRSWESMLRTAVSRVRAMLGALGPRPDATAGISTLNGCYRLDLPPETSIDVHDAVGMLDAALSATLAGDDQAARDHAAGARRTLARAFLPGLSAVWIDNQRDRLSSSLVQTLEVLSSAHARLGESSAAVTTAREAVALQPLRESSHRTLMSAHVAAGNRGEGVRAYQACRTLLMDELGVSPAPETEALYSSIVGSVPHEPPVVPLPPPLPPMLMTEAPFGFVNRVPERSLLLRAADTSRAGPCQLALVSGEGGSGKSQLIAEIARRLAARRTAILYGRCVEGERNGAIIDCLRNWATALPDAAVENVLGPWIGELSRYAPELGTRLRHPSSPSSVGNGAADDGPLLEALARWVQSLAASYPVVLIVEDLQWASERTFAILRYLLASAPPRTLVLASYRSTETVIGHPVSADLAQIVRTGQLCTRIELRGLGVIDVAELLGAALGGDLDENDLALAHQIHRETAGNPYLVERMIRHVLESGRGFDATSIDALLAELDGPIRRWLGRLPADLADYLLAAAVVGTEFDADNLHGATGLEPEHGARVAEQLVERGLLASGDGPTRRLHFVHPIVREVIFRNVTSRHSHRVMRRYLGDDTMDAQAACV